MMPFLREQGGKPNQIRSKYSEPPEKSLGWGHFVRNTSRHWPIFPTRTNRGRAGPRLLAPSGCAERLRRENARLREERQAWQEQQQAWQEEKTAITRAAIHDRQQAGYFKSMHERALQRLLEKDQQIEALKAKVAELTHRVFGRKSESSKSKNTTQPPAKRPRSQQPGVPGHGRQPRKDLPLVEIELDPPADQILCACCNKPWTPCGEPETSETTRVGGAPVPPPHQAQQVPPARGLHL
jgi:hypothetical protein